MADLRSTNAKFNVHHVLSDPSDQWKGLSGRINSDLLQETVFKVCNLNSTFVFICGPVPFNVSALEALKKIGFDDSAKIHVFSEEG